MMCSFISTCCDKLLINAQCSMLHAQPAYVYPFRTYSRREIRSINITKASSTSQELCERDKSAGQCFVYCLMFHRDTSCIDRWCNHSPSRIPTVQKSALLWVWNCVSSNEDGYLLTFYAFGDIYCRCTHNWFHKNLAMAAKTQILLLLLLLYVIHHPPPAVEFVGHKAAIIHMKR